MHALKRNYEPRINYYVIASCLLVFSLTRGCRLNLLNIAIHMMNLLLDIKRWLIPIHLTMLFSPVEFERSQREF
ncbi:MAG: hypothetical protein SAK29_14325 [Scytonema sp. PMC 1069.18]|nr:hypothetical protein [Scytonema sp. PMC 1069.18]MEC4881753.1 hypothetical protein [Scytonema sp. PMC 1070.18]